jgi:hypothetical protein
MRKKTRISGVQRSRAALGVREATGRRATVSGRFYSRPAPARRPMITRPGASRTAPAPSRR